MLSIRSGMTVSVPLLGLVRILRLYRFNLFVHLFQHSSFYQLCLLPTELKTHITTSVAYPYNIDLLRLI